MIMKLFQGHHLSNQKAPAKTQSGNYNSKTCQNPKYGLVVSGMAALLVDVTVTVRWRQSFKTL